MNKIVRKDTQSGITLLALIITIIVLLILAVVSIRLVTNHNVIKYSKDATNNYSSEEEIEKIKLGLAARRMAAVGNQNAELKVDEANVTGSETTGWEVSFIKSGNIYSVDANGNINKKSGGSSTNPGEDTSRQAQMTINVGDTIPSGCYFVSNVHYVRNEETGDKYSTCDIYAESENEFNKCSVEKESTQSTYKGANMPSTVMEEEYLVDTISGIQYSARRGNNNTIEGWQILTMDGMEPKNIKSVFVKIGNYNLTGLCEALKESSITDASKMEIPNTVTYMDLCFLNCASLEKAPKIPTSIQYIDQCFKGCTKLKEATYLGTLEQFKQIDGYATCGDAGLIIHCTNGDYTVQ